MPRAIEADLTREVLLHGPLSRTALTARLGLSQASLTRIARPLLDRGVLVELADVVDGSVGRPSRPLDIAPESGSFAGIKLTGDHLYLAVTDIRAELQHSSSEPLPSRDPDRVIARIREVVGALDARDLRGVGVSLGGYLRGGTVLDAPFLGWTDVPLRSELADTIGVPVSVENDLVALAEAERWFGHGRDLDGFALLTIGAGVGFGLVANQQTVRTPDAGNGTAGHLLLDPQGPLCSEGHRGCAQAMLTTESITAQVSAALRRPVDHAEVLELAAAGQPAARAVTDAAGAALGRLIALAANLTLQPAVIVSGEGIGLYDIARDRIDSAIQQNRNPRAEQLALHIDRSGFAAWARGAAVIAIQSALTDLAS